jgi:hypothetical protein
MNTQGVVSLHVLPQFHDLISVLERVVILVIVCLCDPLRHAALKRQREI